MSDYHCPECGAFIPELVGLAAPVYLNHDEDAGTHEVRSLAPPPYPEPPPYRDIAAKAAWLQWRAVSRSDDGIAEVPGHRLERYVG